ncbi:MAG: restriction endonuclease subunit S [Marinilabiliaceae bacterium]
MNGKQLKNSILQWAIQGKLVPQDPDDEPASVMLDKIRKEKERLIKEKKIKRDKNASVIFRADDNSFYEKSLATGEVKCIDEEIPFDIPSSWCWARLSDLAAYIQRGKSPKYSLVKKYPVVAQKCNQWSGFSIDKAQFIDPETLSQYSEDRILQDEDLMWNSTGLGTLGRMAVYHSNLNPYELAVADSHVTVIRLMRPQVCSLFFYYYFISPTVQNVIEDKADGSTKQKELSISTICNYLVPLPPTAEQVRIASKVGEVLSFVFKYGEQQKKLDTLNIAINNLLKKSILQQAIQGKLVPQIKEEGTAQDLLEAIKAEKQRLVKEGKLKKSALNHSLIFRGADNLHYEKTGKKVWCIEDEIPFEIPEGWEWVRLKDVFQINPKNKAEDNSVSAFIPMEKIMATYGSCFTYDTVRWETIKNGFAHFADGDVAFAKISPCFQNRKSVIFRNLPNGIGAGTTELKVLRLYGEFMERWFLLFFLESPYFVDEAKFKGTANQQRIVSGYLENKLFPLPPLAEQKRIVEKANQLMQLLK